MTVGKQFAVALVLGLSCLKIETVSNCIDGDHFKVKRNS